MRAPVLLESDRLRFTRPRTDDAAPVFERYSSDALVTRYLGWPRHQSIADAEAFIAFSDEEWAQAGYGPYLVRLRVTNELLGGTGLHRRGEREAETGYVFARDAWGRGYATETLQTMLLVATQIGIDRIVATCHVDHRVSARVLEKCGFVIARPVSDQSFPNLPSATALAYQYVRVS
jgi:[ribosomal protein S5]-alanine N-acetyltransferase